MDLCVYLYLHWYYPTIPVAMYMNHVYVLCVLLAILLRVRVMRLWNLWNKQLVVSVRLLKKKTDEISR